VSSRRSIVHKVLIEVQRAIRRDFEHDPASWRVTHLRQSWQEDFCSDRRKCVDFSLRLQKKPPAPLITPSYQVRDTLDGGIGPGAQDMIVGPERRCFGAAKGASLGPSWTEINRICREIFGRDVTPGDDFFKLGGGSISVALLIMKLRLLNLEISPLMVFETPNLGDLSERLDAIRVAHASSGS
jgi:Phosphopantetheine attachment site